MKDSSLVVASVGVSYRSSFMGSRREEMLVSAKGCGLRFGQPGRITVSFFFFQKEGAWLTAWLEITER